MKRAMEGMIVVALMVSLAACDREPASVATDNSELEVLTLRMYDLKDRVVAAGRMTSDQRAELTVLVRDVEAWRARTSRTDIAVTRTGPGHEAAGTTSPLIIGPGGGTGSCEPCPLVKTFGDKVCFLTEESECMSGMIRKVCAYVCLTRTRTASASALPARIEGGS